MARSACGMQSKRRSCAAPGLHGAMRSIVGEWRAVSLNDPPQSLRRRSLAATFAVTLVLFATVACVLLADRPKVFDLAQAMTFPPDEMKYLGPMMAKMGADPDKQTLVVQNMGKIFSEQNRLTSDEVAAASVDASPEYQAAKLQADDAAVAMKKVAAASKLSNRKIRAFLRDSQRKHQAEREAIAEAVKDEKQAEAKLLIFARSNNVKVVPASPTHSESDLLKIMTQGYATAAAPPVQRGALANGAASEASVTSTAFSDNPVSIAAAALNQPVVSADAAAPAFAAAQSYMTASQAAATAEEAVAEAQSVLSSMNLN